MLLLLIAAGIKIHRLKLVGVASMAFSFTKFIVPSLIVAFLILPSLVLPTRAQSGVTISEVTFSSVERTWSDFSLLVQGRWHDSTEVLDEVNRMEMLVPKLVDTEIIGQSYLGKNLYYMRITNELNTEQKAKTLVVAQHHAREQITMEAALRFALLLLNGYGIDDQITHYVDTEEIYIIPTLHPDGLDRVVHFNDHWLRKNLRPYDDDGDGSFDEDPHDDVNEDGFISAFYVFEKPNMRDVVESWYEGIDDDGDGQYNEDAFGNVDLNRNYAMYWGMPPGASNDTTAQTYCGPYAFSEPETIAFRDFALQHQFAMAYTLHSGINATYFPSNDEWISPQPELFQIVRDELWSLLPSHFSPDKRPAMNYMQDDISGHHAGAGGLWKEWMYYGRQTTVPITFEIFHNPNSDNPESYTTIQENETHVTMEWHGIYDYFNPQESRIEDLWQDIKPAFEYLLNMTPRLNVSLEATGGFTDGTTLPVSILIESLSPHLGSSDMIRLSGADGSLLRSLSSISAGEQVPTDTTITLPLDLDNSSYTMRVGNDYSGYKKFIISWTDAPTDPAGISMSVEILAMAISAGLVLSVVIYMKRVR